jgi:hypothetical protein
MSYEKVTRCYTKYDLVKIIFLTIIIIIPMVNLFTINGFISSVNYVNWLNYYDNNSIEYNTTILSDDTDYYLLKNKDLTFSNISVVNNSRNIVNEANYANFNLPYNFDQQLGYTNTVNMTLFGQRFYVLNFGNDTGENMTYYDNFPLNQVVKDYRHLHVISNVLSTLTTIIPINIDDAGDGNITYAIDNEFKNRFHLFPSIWDDFWNNFELYFYMVDSNYNGIGYSYGRNESSSIDDVMNKELIMNGNTYNIDMYMINVSSELRYSNLGNFYYTYYNATKTENQFDFISGALNNFISDLEDEIGIEMGDFGENLTSISSITQHRGFFRQFPFFCNEFGYYIKLSTGFNITKYIETYRYNVNEFDLGEIFTNGVFIQFNDLFLGEIKTLNSAVGDIVVFNIILFLIPTTIIIFISFYPSKSKKQFEEEKNMFCKI